MKPKYISIGKRKIGEDKPAYIIAEVGSNFNGSLARAKKLAKVAKEAGADAVKLQTYTADTITLDCNKSDFRLPPGPWKGFSNLHALYSKAYTPWEWHAELFEHARKIGLEIFSSPFDHTAVDFLEKFLPQWLHSSGKQGRVASGR